MKLKIHKNSRRILILMFSLLLALSAINLYFALSAPRTMLAESVLYEASCEPKVNYQVVINPNEVIAGAIMEENKFYSKKILNYIKADFKVVYAGSDTVPLDIEYQIMGTVNGFSGEDSYWSKSFPLTVKKTVKEEAGSNQSIKESIQFQLSNYDAFAVRAKEITGINATTELTVFLTGKIIAHTDRENLETPFNVSIKLPLMKDVFQITKSGTDPITNKVTAKTEIPAPVNYLRIVPYGVLLAISIIGLIIAFFFTREPNEQEILLKRTKEIIKNYNSRIVAVHNIPNINYKLLYRVKGIKDLIKIADELQKPIFYEVDSVNMVKDYEFHVADNDIRYSFIVDSGSQPPELKERKKSA